MEENKRNRQIITDDLCDTVFFSSLLNLKSASYDYSLSSVILKNFVSDIKEALEPDYKYNELRNTNDIWARDYMPVQIFEDKFFNYKYFPDYLREKKEDEKSITDFRNVNFNFDLKGYNPTNIGNIIADGGNIVKCDNFIIMTQKVFGELDNIIGGMSLDKLREEIGTDVVIIPSDSEDRFGHADGMVRYVKPGTILLRAAQDEEDTKFLDRVEKAITNQKPGVKVERLNLPYINNQEDSVRKHNWCYINFLRIGNKILLPHLGTTDDELVMYQFHIHFKGCDIKPIYMLPIVEAGGGALNCLSWTVKRK